MRFLYFGTDDNYGLCPSYLRAAKKLGVEHRLFDYEKIASQQIPYGKIGKKLFQHLNPEIWIHKINRQFVVQARDYHPSHIFSFTNAPITPAAIMFLKTILPDCKFVLIWPDSILNFKQQTLASLQLYDHIATYGSTSVEVIASMTKGTVQFIPLAGDLEIHGIAPVRDHIVDIGFVGGWRPERQIAIESVVTHFPSLKTEIYGPYWKENCKNGKLPALVKGTGLHGMDMAKFFNRTLINLNVIDDTNYPSANMRFFEVMAAGGLELVSSCPEMESIFLEKQDLLYFHDENSLLEKVNWVLDNKDKILTIKNNGHLKIKNEHNYTERLKSIIKQLS